MKVKTTRRRFLGSVLGGLAGLVGAPRISKSENKKGHHPLLYSNYYGGPWKEWPSDKIVTDAQLEKRADVNILICGLRVHSLRFWRKKGVFTGWKRWDCVDGWNRVPVRINSSVFIDSDVKNRKVLESMTTNKFRILKIGKS